MTQPPNCGVLEWVTVSTWLTPSASKLAVSRQPSTLMVNVPPAPQVPLAVKLTGVEAGLGLVPSGQVQGHHMPASATPLFELVTGGEAPSS